MFKGIAPPSQFPATFASGAPPRPNHACCEEGVDVCFETLWRRGGEGFATRAIRFFFKKKFSPRTMCPQRVHVLCPHTGCTSCAPTRRASKIKGGPQVGGNATSPLHSRGSPTKGTKSKGAHKWAEMLHHPCILGDPQRKGDKIRIGCLTRAFWEAHKWAEMLHHPCILGDPQRKGDKIRIGCLTPAFWEAHKWPKMLHHPCILGDPQQRGQSQSKKKAKKKKTVPWCP